MVPSTAAIHESGTQSAGGSFICINCSLPLSLDHPGQMPECANCGGTRFKRASLFEQPTLAGMAIESPAEAPAAWLAEVRSSSTDSVQIAIHQDGRGRLFELAEGWSRVGRSGSADIRLDDPTVSRRHAVIVRTPEDEIRVLDDRSMNGIAVNGEPVDWSPLRDGDELQVGRYTLYLIAG